MKRSSLFGHIIELYDLVAGGKEPADGVIRSFFRSRHYLGSRDRRYISEIVYSLIRNHRLVRAYANAAVKGPDIEVSNKRLSLLYLAVHALKISGDDLVSLLPDISGLWRMYLPTLDCDSMLRRIGSLSLEAMALADPVERLATLYSLPDSTVEEWVQQLGVEEAEHLCASLNNPAPIAIRTNALKISVEECRTVLQKEGIESTRTSLSPWGLILSKRMNAQSLTSFKSGYFEMQDEGSQLISMLVGATPGMTIVDACAGGGGKTLHLAALMQNDGTLAAIEVDERRLRDIHERIRRAGVTLARTYLSQRDREAIVTLRQKADAVLIDAPCSGVGTFRRNPGAKLTFSDEGVEAIARTQRLVLDEYCLLVKPGGRLVYSTCTLLSKENEEQVFSFLERHPEFELISAPDILIQQGVPVESTSPYLHLLPHRTNTDGFFAAAMVRRDLR